MDDIFSKQATLKLFLRADSGYESREEARVSADQWGRISAVVNEPVVADKLEDARDLLNLADWIDRRRTHIGPYADHIIDSVRRYEAELRQHRSK